METGPGVYAEEERGIADLTRDEIGDVFSSL